MAAQPDIEDVLSSPATSGWLRTALADAMQRDPVDAANDAELLSELLARRCDDMAKQLTR